MTKEDMNGIWKLLGTYRAGDKRLGDKTLLQAWYLVLEPYEAEEVRRAVADYFRERKYWPDVTDIASRCPKPARPVAADPEPGRYDAAGIVPWGFRSFEENTRQLEALVEMGRLMELDYPSRDVPHPREARRQGWSVEVWNSRVRAEFPAMSAGKTGGCSDG